MLATKGICRARMFYYSLVNRLVLYPKTRWLCTLLLVVAYIQNTQKVSYDIATYLIGFYILQLILSYYTPKGILEEEPQHEYEQLYSLQEDIPQTDILEQQENQLEHTDDKPLLRSLNEIQIWQRTTFAFIMGLVCTYFKMLEIDVFWPLLLIYFLVLVIYTVQKILKTMEKHRYGLADFQKQ